MRTNIVALSDKFSQPDLARLLHSNHGLGGQTQRLYPVVDAENRVEGVVTRKDLQQLLNGRNLPSQEDIFVAQQRDGTEHSDAGGSESDYSQKKMPLQYVRTQPVVAYPDESLRAVINRMAETGYTRLPVVERNDPRKLIGMISLFDLLKARGRSLEEERHRERVLRLRLLFPSRSEGKIEQN